MSFDNKFYEIGQTVRASEAERATHATAFGLAGFRDQSQGRLRRPDVSRLSSKEQQSSTLS